MATIRSAGNHPATDDRHQLKHRAQHHHGHETQGQQVGGRQQFGAPLRAEGRPAPGSNTSAANTPIQGAVLKNRKGMWIGGIVSRERPFILIEHPPARGPVHLRDQRTYFQVDSGVSGCASGCAFCEGLQCIAVLPHLQDILVLPHLHIETQGVVYLGYQAGIGHGRRVTKQHSSGHREFADFSLWLQNPGQPICHTRHGLPPGWLPWGFAGNW